MPHEKRESGHVYVQLWDQFQMDNQRFH
jgi:hypothetical protein